VVKVKLERKSDSNSCRREQEQTGKRKFELVAQRKSVKKNKTKLSSVTNLDANEH